MTYLQTRRRRATSTSRARWFSAALVFDVLDGRIARWRQTSSALGRELDSLADVISFGVAPAALAYACGMQGFCDRVVAGVLRRVRRVAARALQRHRRGLSEGTDKVTYFEGTPIPTSIVLVGVLALAAYLGAIGERLWFGEIEIGGFRLHRLALLFALSGSLMISRIRIPKL